MQPCSLVFQIIGDLINPEIFFFPLIRSETKQEFGELLHPYYSICLSVHFTNWLSTCTNQYSNEWNDLNVNGFPLRNKPTDNYELFGFSPPGNSALLYIISCWQKQAADKAEIKTKPKGEWILDLKCILLVARRTTTNACQSCTVSVGYENEQQVSCTSTVTAFS